MAAAAGAGRSWAEAEKKGRLLLQTGRGQPLMGTGSHGPAHNHLPARRGVCHAAVVAPDRHTAPSACAGCGLHGATPGRVSMLLRLTLACAWPFLAQGADPVERDALGYMPLHLLCHYGCSAAPPPPLAAAQGGSGGGGGQLELAAARLLVEEARAPLAAKTTCFAYEADVRAEVRVAVAVTLAAK
jgi:hypothetical protein